MRKVAFRAFDTVYKHMYANAYPFEHLVYVEIDKNDPNVSQYEHRMMKVHGKWFYWLLAHEVQLMEYTNLLDKAGTEIWEGDILAHYNIQGKLNGVYTTKITVDIHTCDGLDFTYMGVHFVMVGIPEPTSGLRSSYPLLDDMTVVGNIYEHPHLLES